MTTRRLNDIEKAKIEEAIAKAEKLVREKLKEDSGLLIIFDHYVYLNLFHANLPAYTQLGLKYARLATKKINRLAEKRAAKSDKQR